MSVVATEHAIDRYLERIAPVEREEARKVIEGAARTIELAVRLGGHIVRLGTGGKLIVRGTDPIRVVTVLGHNSVAEREQLQLTQPACCGLCGLRCSHPIASACIRPECPLGAQRRNSNNQQGGRP